MLIAGLSLPDAAAGDRRGLSLNRAIRLCLAHPKILAGAELVRQAQADARTAALLPNPALTVEGGLLPLSRRYTEEEPGGPMELSAGISYPMDQLVFGKRAASIASADAGVTAARAELADVIRLRVEQTAQAFYGVLELEALLKLATLGVDHLEQVAAATRTAVASGGRPQVELGRVRLELQAARREARLARTAVLLQRSSLRAQLGESVPLDVVIDGTLDGPLAVEPLSVGAAVAAAQKNRPDILALRSKVLRARRDVVLERRNALPQTSIGLGVAHQFQRSIGAPDVTAWGVSVEVTLPLFDRNQGHRARAASVATQGGHELKAALLDLHAEVEQAVQSLRTALQNAREMAQTDLKLATQVRDSFRTAYAAGGRSLIETLDAQRNYHETYRAYTTGRADYFRAVCRYKAALGLVAGRKVIP